jgi:hypothetical protein
MKTDILSLLFDWERKHKWAVVIKGRRKNLISNRSFFFFLKLSGMLIQIISRREDYRLYIHRVIESTSLFLCCRKVIGFVFSSSYTLPTWRHMYIYNKNKHEFLFSSQEISDMNIVVAALVYLRKIPMYKYMCGSCFPF